MSEPLGMEGLVTENVTPKRAPAKKKATKKAPSTLDQDEIIHRTLTAKESAVEAWDRTLFEKELPPNKVEARYLGNLFYRLTAGITRDKIEKMTVRDRIAAASVCLTNRNLAMDRPTENVQFSSRLNDVEMMKQAQAILERRRRERQIIDVTPGTSDG